MGSLLVVFGLVAACAAGPARPMATPPAPTPSAPSAAPPAAPPPPSARSTCAAGETFCAEGHVRRCASDGASSDVVSPCSDAASCHLTSAGPACSACAPDAPPSCLDDRTAATCDASGAWVKTDCAAQKKRCLNGVCAERACAPGELACDEGNVVRCNAAGSGYALEKKCRPDDGVCWWDEAHAPACRTSCTGGDGLVLATFECDACDWGKVPFCAKEGPTRACGSALCEQHQIGAGADPVTCMRETDGLVVPGSEVKGACEGEGSVGVVTVRYQVCSGGRAASATRSYPCRR